MFDKMSPLGIALKDMKALVIEAATKLRNGDFERLNRTIANLAVTRGLAETPVSTDLSRRYGTMERHKVDSLAFGLSDEDVSTVCDIMCDLVVEGIIRPGLADGEHFEFPKFHVTEPKPSSDRVNHLRSLGLPRSME